MIIVSGSIRVDPASRDAYLEGCRVMIEGARSTPGCLDFHLAADPVEPDRINIYEQWDSVAAVEAFRGHGPSPDQMAEISSAAAYQHEIAASVPL